MGKNLNQKIIDDLSEISENDDKKITEYAKDYLREFNRKGNEYRNIFYTFSFLILAVSVLTPLLNSLVGQDNKIVFLGSDIQTIKFYTSVLAVVSAVSAGTLQIVQASDRLILERITKINLEREIVLYKTNGGIYSVDNDPTLEKIQKTGATLAAARRSLFSQRLTEIIVNKFNRFYAFGSNGRRNQDDTTSANGAPGTTPSAHQDQVEKKEGAPIS